MPAARRNALTEAFFRIHPWIYRKTGGRLLGRFGKAPVLLLTTRGRKSGQPRTNGLVYVDRGDHWVVAASWAGEPKHPLWYLNLRADPQAKIQVGDREIPVRARELEGDQRDLAWKEIVAQDPGFAVYEERTRGIREIPVVLLEPRDAGDATGATDVPVLYGMSCSYFTGKLEAYLRTKGVPFRDAHEAVGRLVMSLGDTPFREATPQQLTEAHPLLSSDDVPSVAEAAARRPGVAEEAARLRAACEALGG